MKSLRSWVSAATLMLVLVPASVALAQPGFSDDDRGPGEAGRGRGGPGFFQRMDGERGPFAGLDLTEAQKAKLEEIREAGQTEGATLRKQMMRLRNELHGEMLQDKPDRRKVVQLAGQIGAVQTKFGVHRAEQHLAMLDVLTTKQRDQWLTRPHAGPGGHRRGHGGRGMGAGEHGPRGFGGGGSHGR